MFDSENLGENLRLWFGIVEDDNDTEKNLGRVKVRILGFHTPNRAELPTEDLPWAIVMNPTDNPAINNKGQTSSNLRAGSMVCGFFLDGGDAQQPIVLGSLFSKLVDTSIIANKPEEGSIEDKENPGAIYLSEEIEAEPVADKQLAAKSRSASRANPNGTQAVPIANGTNGPERTMFYDMFKDLNLLGNSFYDAVLYDYTNIRTVISMTKDQNYIRVSDTSNLPKSGIIQIDNEIMSYNDKNDKYLVEVTRGIYNTEATEHEFGSLIRFIEKEANGKPKEIVSKWTDKVIDFRKEVDRTVAKIRGYITWLVNTIKSTLTSLVSDAIVQLGRFLKSVFPFQTRIIIEALYKVLQRIECDFGKSFIDGIINKVKKFVEDMVNKLINLFLKNVNDFLEPITNCLNNIFDSVVSISLFVEDILNLIDSAVSTISRVNNLSNISTKTSDLRNSISGFSGYSGAVTFDNTDRILDNLGSTSSTINRAKDTVASADASAFVERVNTVGNTVGLLLDLLGIGCNKSTSPPRVDLFTTDGSGVNSQIKLECAEFTREANIESTNKTFSASFCGFTDKDINIDNLLKQYRRPVDKLRKIFSDGQNYIVEVDSTPGAEYLAEYGPKQTSTVVTADGNRTVTVNGNNYQIVADNDNVNIKGSCYVTVEGDYHLKVNGDYHLEVVGEYNVYAGSESKQTFAGEHTTLYKNSAKINAGSGIALSGSKIGLSAAGNVDLECSGAFSLTGGEANLNVRGSFNIGCFTKNEFIALNAISTVLNNKISLVGVNEFKSALSSAKLAGANMLDLTTGNKSSIRIGSSQVFTGGIDVENVNGLLLQTGNSAKFDFSKTIKLNNTGSLNFNSARLYTFQ